MARDMSPVGASATSSKSAAMSDYNEVFSGRVTVEEAEDGSFIIRAGYRKELKPGKKASGYCDNYCPDKEYTASDSAAMMAKVASFYGKK